MQPSAGSFCSVHDTLSCPAVPAGWASRKASFHKRDVPLQVLRQTGSSVELRSQKLTLGSARLKTFGFRGYNCCKGCSAWKVL
eukprot:scaffold1883_cov396-Prasinococcus_capsulatus_cf.AAC.14